LRNKKITVCRRKEGSRVWSAKEERRGRGKRLGVDTSGKEENRGKVGPKHRGGENSPREKNRSLVGRNDPLRGGGEKVKENKQYSTSGKWEKGTGQDVRKNHRGEREEKLFGGKKTQLKR